MAEKKYYWLKLPRDFFKRHDIKFIKTLPNGREIAFFYTELMAESVDHDGELRFSPEIPYSEGMLAVLTDTPIEIVTEAMKVLKEFGLVIISEDGTIILPKVEKMIGSAGDSDNAKRQQRYRDRKKAEKLANVDDNVTSNVTHNVTVTTNSNESKSKSKSKSKRQSKSIERNTKESGLAQVSPIAIEELTPEEILGGQVLSEEEKMFMEFWEAYPKKVDKKGSLRAFKNIPKLKATFPDIMAALEIQKKSQQWTKDNGQYIPNPTTYIHQERWTTVTEKDETQAKIDEVVKQNYQKFLF